jgi:hypothetical protein
MYVIYDTTAKCRLKYTYNLFHICAPINLYIAVLKVLPLRHGIFCRYLLDEDILKMRRDTPKSTNWTQYVTIFIKLSAITGRYHNA